MKDTLTELVFILDMSGSMSDLRDDTIGGYNTLLEEQRKQEGDANVTTVLFDDRYILLHDRVDIKDVPNITDKEYAPRGMTALLDAVGRTINAVGEKLAATPEEERPGNVTVTIITDGMENASKEYTWKAVKDMITEQREKYSWTFAFIGANIDTMQVSDDLGIDRKMSRSYTASQAGTASVYSSVSNAVKKQRSFSMSFAKIDKSSMSADDEMALRKSIMEAAEEEMAKELDDIE